MGELQGLEGLASQEHQEAQLDQGRSAESHSADAASVQWHELGEEPEQNQETGEHQNVDTTLADVPDGHGSHCVDVVRIQEPSDLSAPDSANTCPAPGSEDMDVVVDQ